MLMPIFVILTFAFSLVLLAKSSGYVIKYGLVISKILGVSTFVIGFLLVSVVTSLPELLVTIFSVIQNEPNLAVGNILGSNLIDLTIVAGLVVIFGGTVYMKKKETISLIELLFIVSILMLFIFQTGSLTQVHGLILIILFGFLMVRLYKHGRVSKELYDGHEERHLYVWLKFLGSLAVLIAAAHFLVESSLWIADYFLLSATLVGVTLVAMGTSIPELSVEIRAVKAKQYSFAMGDLFGSAITNSTLVLGTLSLLSPTTVNIVPLAGLMPFLMISILFLWYLFSTKRKITRYEAGILLGIYVAYIFTTFIIEELLGIALL
ncbi:MAG: sodium:calcium antiporter [Candidatus Aenigmatarchaeota archaeon]